MEVVVDLEVEVVVKGGESHRTNLYVFISIEFCSMLHYSNFKITSD